MAESIVTAQARSSPTKALMGTYVRAPEVFVSGDGARLVTADGTEFLDMLGGIAVSALGHGHAGLSAALSDQASKLLHTSNLYRHPLGEELATRLARLTGMASVFFSNSGAEANECALKIARAYQHRRGDSSRTAFIALEGGFHGRTLGALSVSSGERYRAPFEPLVSSVSFLPPGDVGELTRALGRDRPAALIMEPIQGEGGLRPLPLPYLRAARELCTRTGTVLIHDEVQCGCGRTGPFLAGDAAGVKPDVVTLAKPLAAGVPIGATLTSSEFADALIPGDHGSTFGGGPLAARAALVVLDEWERGLDRNVRRRAAQLRRGLDALVARFDSVIERRGRGLMHALALAGQGHAARLRDLCHARGLLTCPAAGETLRLLPPFVVSRDDIDQALAILANALADL